MEPIHVARLFDIATGMGSKVEAAARIVQARSLSILKKAKDDFRSVIDAGTPSFYLIDINKDIIAPISKDYDIKDTQSLQNQLQVALEGVAFTTSYADFKRVIETAYSKADRALQSLTGTSATHLAYRDIFRELGQDVSKAFKALDPKDARAIVRITDPESLGYPNKLVFVGKSFDLIQKNINKAINTTLASYLNVSSFSYGKYMAAGHTAIKLGNDTYGTNTPATQEALFKLEQASRTQTVEFDKFKFQNDFVQSVPLFMEYALDIKKDFSFARTLLDINFTFVVPMPASANSASGSVERKAIENLTKTVVLPGLADAMKARLSWLKEVAVNLRSSDSMVDYVQAIMTEVLSKGTKSRKLKQTVTNSGKQKIADVVFPKVGNKKAPNKVSASTAKAASLTSRKDPVLDLLSIQTFINLHLQDVISANMGDGGRRDVLNYRTGRFASSVQVERLTMSREGMITAFYTYMKNPYSTFSDGGAQSSPQSRDPKLLISKSIREIAAEKIANKLRAVSV
jgi:hypothetical protein